MFRTFQFGKRRFSSYILYACIAGISWYRWPSLGNQCVSYMTYPLLYVQMNTVDYLTQVTDRIHIARAYRKLIEQYRTERAQLLARVTALEAQQAYAADVAEVRAFYEQYPIPGKVAQILHRTITDESHTILLDAGAARGIDPDMIVVWNNQLIGRIVTVYPWYSKAVLITDKSCSVPARGAHARAPGIHVGMNKLSETQLAYVSHLAPVTVGELVLTSGEGIIYPAGLGLGTVAACSPDSSGFMLHITVTPTWNIQELRYCLICSKQEIATYIATKEAHAHPART